MAARQRVATAIGWTGDQHKGAPPAVAPSSISRHGSLRADPPIRVGVLPVSKKMAFIMLRLSMSTMECVLISIVDAVISMHMVCFDTSLSKESILDAEGVISLPREPLKATTQKIFRKYLSSKSFIGIHSPKLISGASVGSAA